MITNYKKLIIMFFLSVFSVLIIIKYSVSILKNQILDIIKSDRFDVFIVNIIDEKLEKISNMELSDYKKKFYKEKIEKILSKIEEIN